MATVTVPLTVGDATPELGVDVRSLRKAARKLGGVFYKRIVAVVYNEMNVAAINITEGAKDDLSAFDNPDSTKGLLAQGLYHWAQPKVTKRGLITMGFGWTRRYGRVLEFGPSITEWMIYPKWKKALRWTATNFHGPTRSGVAGQKTMFAKAVRHKWSRKQLRPHLVPAVKKGIPRLEKRIARGIEREFMRTRLNG